MRVGPRVQPFHLSGLRLATARAGAGSAEKSHGYPHPVHAGECPLECRGCRRQLISAAVDSRQASVVAKLAYQSDTPFMARCSAVTQDGTLCRNKVKEPGQRCYLHRGFTAARRRVPQSRTKGSTRSRPRTARPASSQRMPAVRSQAFWQPSPNSVRPQRSPGPPPAASRSERDRRRVREAAGVLC